MNPAAIAKKLKRAGRNIPPRSSTIVRTIAATKQSVEMVTRCRSVTNRDSKIAGYGWQCGVYFAPLRKKVEAAWHCSEAHSFGAQPSWLWAGEHLPAGACAKKTSKM